MTLPGQTDLDGVGQNPLICARSGQMPDLLSFHRYRYIYRCPDPESALAGVCGEVWPSLRYANDMRTEIRDLKSDAGKLWSLDNDTSVLRRFRMVHSGVGAH